MKRMLVLLVVFGLVAGFAAAQSTNVTSVNIVGYNKITCPAGKYVLKTTAFKSIDGGSLDATAVFGDQLPIGSKIYAYDTVTGTYKIDTKSFFGWSANIVFEGGMGFWIYNAGGSDVEVSLNGEVPLEDTVSSLVVDGFSLMGFPYTADVAWTNTTLAQEAAIGDKLYVFDPDTGYSVYTRSFFGWDAAAQALTLTQDMGFWYSSSAMRTNVETRPYNP